VRSAWRVLPRIVGLKTPERAMLKAVFRLAVGEAGIGAECAEIR